MMTELTALASIAFPPPLPPRVVDLLPEAPRLRVLLLDPVEDEVVVRDTNRQRSSVVRRERAPICKSKLVLENNAFCQ